MVSCLPTWPLALFGVIEPAMLVWAYINFVMDPFKYFADQAPFFAATDEHFYATGSSLVLADGKRAASVSPDSPHLLLDPTS
ncbi:hypothetical protein CEP52_006182 [Fusarium oligoseptatum]|uniref:DUF7704 domain-containing protein n=1 Tax=Fusarium oligoseptatum TaxID=2604345 RepID=A0A428TU78_9HYPO|nr:hypothetical protein CEP52_006182 [Fusarium oligoseptatum]